MRSKILTTILTVIPLLACAQNDIQISHQLFNRVYYNPAAAGASQYINGILIGRQQWVGFPNSPKTMLFSTDGYFQNINSGLGLSVIADKLGLERTTNAIASYSYHVKINERSNLSFGLAIGVLYKSIKVNEMVFPNPGDPGISSYLQDDSRLNPDFNFGVEYNMEKLTLGASVTHIDRSSSSIDNLSSSRHFYLYGRYKLEVSRDWDIVPTFSAQSNVQDVQLELNMMTFYDKKYWLGLSYRTNRDIAGESLVGIIGLYITKNIRLGYSYDLNVGSMSSYNNGSHELMIGLRLKPQTSYSRKTPRLFLEY